MAALTSAPLEQQNAGRPARKPAQGSCLASGPHRLVGSAGSGISVSYETPTASHVSMEPRRSADVWAGELGWVR